MKKVLTLTIVFILSGLSTVLADKFVPEFDKMTNLKCTINEEIFEQDGKPATKNVYYRYYKLDDEKQKIYLQKAPVDKILSYDDEKIEFLTQHLTDDFIMQSKIVINKMDNSIKSTSEINYDSDMFPNLKAKGIGTCEILK